MLSADWKQKSEDREKLSQKISTHWQVTVPVLSIVIGEGGSGGALAFAVCRDFLR